MSETKGQTLISLRVSPRASKNEVTGVTEGVLYVRITAPPFKGKANYELINFLSDRLGIPRDHLNIVRGHNSRNKVISVKGLTRDEVVKRLIPG